MKDVLYEVRCLKSNEDRTMILALTRGQFKQLSHDVPSDINKAIQVNSTGLVRNVDQTPCNRQNDRWLMYQ